VGIEAINEGTSTGAAVLPTEKSSRVIHQQMGL
jgi:hypothetical protein